MASAPAPRPPVTGRIDANGLLVAADPPLEALQREAGSALGRPLALPQVAAVAGLARKLGIPVARNALAASQRMDLELWVRATPQGEEVLISIESWTERLPAPPRLSAMVASQRGSEPAATPEWSADPELRIVSLGLPLAQHLGVDAGEAAGQPLTRIVRFEENDEGEMPLLAAVAARRAFTGQRATSRRDDSHAIVLEGEVTTGPDGAFTGFRGTATIVGEPGIQQAPAGNVFDDALDEALRGPLDRIIASAERITDRADGPLRSDYASYGSDIAAAARHLLSVIRSMNEAVSESSGVVDLATLAAEAVVLLEASAEERGIEIALTAGPNLPARGEERAVIQILVNLIGNAVRHSPAGSRVDLVTGINGARAYVVVSDRGPGIEAVDQQRIFGRFERAHEEGGTGLGLAISRRLARSMGGDVTLESAPGQGAHFTLSLPAA